MLLRKVSNDKLVPIIMEKVTRLDLSRNINCKCTSSKRLKRCFCAIASVPCFVSCLYSRERGKSGGIDTEGSSSESDHDSESDE